MNMNCPAWILGRCGEQARQADVARLNTDDVVANRRSLLTVGSLGLGAGNSPRRADQPLDLAVELRRNFGYLGVTELAQK